MIRSYVCSHVKPASFLHASAYVRPAAHRRRKNSSLAAVANHSLRAHKRVGSQSRRLHLQKKLCVVQALTTRCNMLRTRNIRRSRRRRRRRRRSQRTCSSSCRALQSQQILAKPADLRRAIVSTRHNQSRSQLILPLAWSLSWMGVCHQSRQRLNLICIFRQSRHRLKLICVFHRLRQRMKLSGVFCHFAPATPIISSHVEMNVWWVAKVPLRGVVSQLRTP